MTNDFDFENTSIDLEQLLRSKSWSQLNGSEREEAMKFVAGESEYDQLYAMMHQLRSASGIHDESLKPSADVRENLLAAFDAEQKKRKAGWLMNVTHFLNNTIRFDVPAVRLAVAAVLLVGGIYFAMKFVDTETHNPGVVNNETTQPSAPLPGNVPSQEQPVNPQPSVPVQQQPENVVEQNNWTDNDGNNLPQMVQVPAPVIVDTGAANRIAMIPDTNAVVMPLVVNAGTNAFCCGTSNGSLTLSPTAVSGATYSWTNSGTPTIVNLTNGLPTRSRSLANDTEVLDVFFAVK